MAAPGLSETLLGFVLSSSWWRSELGEGPEGRMLSLGVPL